MEPISLSEVAEATRGILIPETAQDVQVRDISTDSRTVKGGELFVPLKGEHFDGHQFIKQALERKASAYLTETEPLEVAGNGTPAVKVHSSTGALMNLARYYRNKRSTLVVGITGTNGKTTTKDLLGRVLSKAGPTIWSERSFNNFVGLPATIFRIEDDTRYAVLEMGTNSPGEICALTGVAAPEVGIVTNISVSHLVGLKDRDGIIREKSALLSGLTGRRVAVLNRDDPSFDLLAEAVSGQAVTFGICHRSDYTATQINVDFEGVGFEVNGIRIHLPLLGLHSIYNALAVFACASELGVAPERIASVCAEFEGPPMRLKPIQKGSLLVINDAYNANPGSMESAIKTFSVLPKRGRKVVVLGDMLELGDQAPVLHRQVGEQLSCGDFDLVIAVGALADDYIVGARKRGVPEQRLLSFEDTKDAVGVLPGMLVRDDSVLIKGSRKMGLESIVEAVLAAGI
jgi:UDP-N-acetylmuramoyl-tripeptide--D-alanyl-D-alanine ligase